MNEFFEEVHGKLNVFVLMMLKWIFGDLDGTMIVVQKGGRLLLLESKL
jgi:hypothetical protein